ncbi:MAG: hypothetical protein H7Z74_08085 [Anaerolineae bacterium]|nr:hypothetical protein [Gemmatimonadaceae bacterium]
MTSIFLLCAVVGGGVLVIQFALTLFGVHHGGDLPHDAHDVGVSHAHEGLNLFSVRAISAGVAFFGLTGLGALRLGWSTLVSLLAAVAAGGAAMLLVALALRSMLRLESDGSIRMENALGVEAQVYVPIPGERAGAGKVTLTIQGRTVECQAVTRGEALTTGTAVLVVDVLGADKVEVALPQSVFPLMESGS